jgi:hypothetical protein
MRVRWKSLDWKSFKSRSETANQRCLDIGPVSREPHDIAAKGMTIVRMSSPRDLAIDVLLRVRQQFIVLDHLGELFLDQFVIGGNIEAHFRFRRSVVFAQVFKLSDIHQPHELSLLQILDEFQGVASLVRVDVVHFEVVESGGDVLRIKADLDARDFDRMHRIGFIGNRSQSLILGGAVY